MTGRNWIWVGLGAVVLLRVASGAANGSLLLGMITVIIGATLIHIALHELGHAIVGALVGFRVTHIVTGSGPQIVAVRLFGCRIEWRLIPSGGVTRYALRHPDDATQWIRVKFFLAALAGPLATAVVGFIIAPMISPEIGTTTTLADGRTAFMGLSDTLGRLGIWLLIANLLPFGGRDGHTMLRMIRSSDQEIERLGEMLGAADTLEKLKSHDLDGAIEAVESVDNVDNPIVLANHGAALCMAGRFRDARQVLIPLVDGGFEGEVESAAVSNLAIACLESGDTELIWEAEDWLRRTDEARDEHDPVRILAWGLRSLVHQHTSEALEWANAGIGAAQRKKDTGQEGNLWMLRARAHATDGNVFDAQRDAESALRCSPDHPSLLRQRTAVDDACLRHLAKVIESSGQLPEVLTTAAAAPMREAARRAITSREPIEVQLLLALNPEQLDLLLGALGVRRREPSEGLIVLD